MKKDKSCGKKWSRIHRKFLGKKKC